jgi:Fic family protein
VERTGIYLTPPVTDRHRRALVHIDRLRADLRFRLRWSESLRRLSLARAVRSSNAIEGFDASLDDVLAEGEGEDALDPSTETPKALRGYREAMTMVLQLADDPDFEHHPMLIRSLQFMMTSYDLGKRPGRWRAGQVFVTDDETGESVYEGPPAESVPYLVDILVAELCLVDDTPPLIRAAMAHLNLAMIHPFKDGNGRMARCLQTLVLAREGVLSPIFCSVEEYLGENTPAYYEVLASVGRGHWAPDGDAEPWVELMLLAHYRQARRHLLRVRETERLWGVFEAAAAADRLPVRVAAAMYDAAAGLRVRNATYRTAHEDDLTEQVASRDLKALVDAGWLQSLGEKRGRRYLRTSRLAELREEVRAASERSDAIDPFTA